MPPERIILIRHGVAVDPDVWSEDDDQRPLTPIGERRAAQVARGLKQFDIRADVILSSPLPRAWRTAEITAGVLRMTSRLEPAPMLSVHHSAEQIRRVLLKRPERIVMAVGHNMSLSHLIGQLIGFEPGSPLISEMRKSGVASLKLIDPHGDRYLLDWLATPKLLRRLGKRR